MFNKTYITERAHTNYVPYAKTVNITEKKAPTDESIKIYAELQRKALESISETIEVKNHIVEGKIIRFIDDMTSDNEKVLVVFKINGQEFSEVHKIPRDHIMRNSREKLIENFIDVFKDYLMREVFKDLNPLKIMGGRY